MRSSTGNNRQLDETDQRILDELQWSGRISNREIARRIKLSEAAVRKRVDRLQAEGALQFFVAVDPSRMGLRLNVVLGMHVNLAHLRQVADALAELPEVTHLFCTSGTFDLVASGVFESEDDLFHFITDKLGAMEGVQKVEASHVLKVAKRTFGWGLPTPGGPGLRPEAAS